MVTKRCGCRGACSCDIRAGRGLVMTGSGSRGFPLTVEVTDGAATYLRGGASNTVAMDLAGKGTLADPYRLRADAFAGAAVVTSYRFSAAGSYVWEKPSFGTLALATIVGAGGGGAGAGGAGQNSGLYAGGVQNALGGKGGVAQCVELLLADLPDTLTVTVGAGGVGGTAPTTPASASPVTGATPGQPGGASVLGGVMAPGGAGGLVTVQASAAPTTEPRSTPLDGDGGSGGLYLSQGYLPPAFDTYSFGQNGADGYPGVPGTGGVDIAGRQGGRPSPLPSRPRGGGGRGGDGGYLDPDGDSGLYAGDGSSGGPGGGGGGGGSGRILGGNGGPGGAGIIYIVIQ